MKFFNNLPQILNNNNNNINFDNYPPKNLNNISYTMKYCHLYFCYLFAQEEIGLVLILYGIRPKH